VFHPRCPLAIDRCTAEVPSLREIAPGRLVACHRAEEVLAGAELSAPVGIARQPGAVQAGSAQPGTARPASPPAG
jgi:hypothetical protein